MNASLLSQLECPICTDGFVQPITLHCQHSFCRECLKQWSKGGASLTCPTCRSMQQLPPGGIDDIQTNPILQSLVETSRRLPDKTPCFGCGKVANLQICHHCETLICSSCIKAHKPEQFIKISSTIRTLDRNIPINKRTLDKLEKSSRELHKSKNDMKARIKNTFGLYKDLLSKRQAFLEEVVDAELDNEIQNVDTKKEDLRLKLNEWEELKEIAEGTVSLWKNSDDRTVKQIMGRIQGLEEKDFELSEVPGRLKFDTSFDLTPIIQLVGVLTIGPDDEQATVEKPLLWHYMGYRFARQMVDLHHGPQQLSAYKDLLFVAIPSGQKVYIVDGGKIKCSIHPKEGEHGRMNRPRGLAVLPGGAVVVSDAGQDRLSLFLTNGQFQGYMGESGSGKGQFNKPLGLAVHNNEIYVCDRQNHRIQVVSASSGSFIRLFGSKDLKSPLYVAVSPDGRVVVTDLHGIKVFSPHGKLINKIKIDGVTKNDEFGGARGVAVDKHGFILVTIKKRKVIDVYYPDLTLCCTFGGEELNDPESVCIFENGRVAVGDFEQNKIIIF